MTQKLFFLFLFNKIFHFLTFHSPPIQRRPSTDTIEQSAVDVPGLFAMTDCWADKAGCIVSDRLRELGTNHSDLKKKTMPISIKQFWRKTSRTNKKTHSQYWSCQMKQKSLFLQKQWWWRDNRRHYLWVYILDEQTAFKHSLKRALIKKKSNFCLRFTQGRVSLFFFKLLSPKGTPVGARKMHRTLNFKFS